MAAPMKQTWAVRNYLFTKFKHFKCQNSKRCRSQNFTTSKGNYYKVTANIGERPIEISTGQFARMADGAAVAKQGDTTVLVTAISKTSQESPGFLPLTVDYRQKSAAAGRIPTNYLRRELGPSEKEILTSRLIDRSLRPMFPVWFEHETQIVCNLMAVDGENNPDVLSINAASAALALSDIPWRGPVGAVRIGMIDGEFVVNPTRLEQQKSVLDLVFTGCITGYDVMLEASAKNISDSDFRNAVRLAASEVKCVCEKIVDLRNNEGKQRRNISGLTPPEEAQAVHRELLTCRYHRELTAVLKDFSHNKFSRDKALNEIRTKLYSLGSNFPQMDSKRFMMFVDYYIKLTFRLLTSETGIRCDGRRLDDLRNISCEVDLFPPLHGSSLFQRGQTQVLSTVTFDSLDSAAKVDTVSELLGGIKDKNFMLHYEFPPYATNEIQRTGASSRREIGHGALAEKGLRPIIPDNFPFTIRLTSEVLESNGSSSMASICGGSLALMDAGVPISEPAAGVAIGLIEDRKLGYTILTDILGIEDYMGDMDFKMAGTESGITALQADIKKKEGIPMEVVDFSITKARSITKFCCDISHKELTYTSAIVLVDALQKILQIMKETQNKPRDSLKKNGPRTEVLTVSMAERGRLIGTGGMNLKKLTSETGVRVTSIDECNFQLFAHNQQAMDEAQEMIKKFLTEERAPELEFGAIYTGKIVEIRPFGTMVQLHPLLEPVLCHTTQLDTKQVNHPSALGMKVGDEISVKYFGRDPANGRVRISRKVLMSPLSRTRQFIVQDDKS